MAWNLKFYDGTTTINFLGTIYKVHDGGFNISTPRTTRDFAQTRSGFYIPVKIRKTYREAEISFEVVGATRAEILSSLQTIERMLDRLDRRKRPYAGQRAEMQYGWDGSAGITYFEVFGGELEYPDDLLSVEKLHKIENDKYVVPECKLTLYLSPQGYGLSVHSTSMTEIPLDNSSIGAKATGGVTIKNPASGNENWVDIVAADVAGQGPMITKITLASGGTYEDWNMLFMGLCVSPQPSKVRFEESELVDTPSGTSTAGGSGGFHLVYPYSGTVPSYPGLSDYRWQLTENTTGLFYGFWHSYGGMNADHQYALGVDDYTTWQIKHLGQFYRPRNDQGILPVGSIQLPPVDPAVMATGLALNPDLEVAFFIGKEAESDINLDFLYLMPINDGLRVLVAHGNSTVGTTVDDDWTGALYLIDGSNELVVPFFGVSSPIRLVPNKNQRLYFNACSFSATTSEKDRTMTVRVYGVPTYNTLAL